jgi:hypothetical protein
MRTHVQCSGAERRQAPQTWSMSPDIQAMWRVARSGELGRLIAINTWLYTDWPLKPRGAEELDLRERGPSSITGPFSSVVSSAPHSGRRMSIQR